MWGRRACLAAVGGAVGFGGQSAFLPVRCEEGAGAGAGLGTGFFGFFENLVSSSSSSSMPGSVRDLSPDERARMRDEFFKYTPPFPVNPDNGIVFFELGFDGKSVGRVEFEVFDDSSPLLATNFKALSQGFMWGYPIATKKNTYRHDKLRKFLRYKNTLFHKVQPGYLCLGGDNERFDGTGGEAFNGCNMRDCFRGKGGRLPGPGCVASVRHAKQVNRSQFLITFRAMPHLEGQNSCFAQVVKGWEVMQEVEKLGTPSGHPRAEVSVCGWGLLLLFSFLSLFSASKELFSLLIP